MFYFHGFVGTVLFVLFGTVYRNSPRKHPCVGSIELNKINVGKSALNKDQLRKIPYFDIMKTASVWAVSASVSLLICFVFRSGSRLWETLRLSI